MFAIEEFASIKYRLVCFNNEVVWSSELELLHGNNGGQSHGVLIDYANGGRRIQLPAPTHRWVHVPLQGVGATTL